MHQIVLLTAKRRRIGALLAFCVLSSTTSVQAGGQEGVPGICAGASSEWIRTLTVGEDALRRSDATPLRALALTEQSPAHSLKTILLAEIDDDADVSQPRPVWTPEPNISDADEKLEIRPVVMVRGEVTECGFFREPSLLASSGDTEVDREILRAAGEARFRPAWRDGRWRSASAILTIRIRLE